MPHWLQFKWCTSYTFSFNDKVLTRILGCRDRSCCSFECLPPSFVFYPVGVRTDYIYMLSFVRKVLGTSILETDVLDGRPNTFVNVTNELIRNRSERKRRFRMNLFV
jgi:hypothetical protein